MNNKFIIEIAIASDSNYLVPTTVLLKSLFDNNKSVQLCINLLHICSTTTDKDLSFWEEYTIAHGHLFRKLPVSDEFVSTFKEMRHTKTTYLRFWLPSLLPSNVNKVLCIDADLIVLRDLSDLYLMDISNYYAAAVKETTSIYAKFDENIFRRLNDLGISPNSFYFQSGVMLMNLKKMREDDIVSKCIAFADGIHDNHLMTNPDQDTLNAILKSAIKYIPPKYNMNYNVEPDIVNALWSREDINEAKTNPVIIHYIGLVKPWNYLSYHPKTKLWWKYLRMTPFKDFKPKNKSFGNFFRKYYLKIIKTIDYNITVSSKRKFGKIIPAPLKKWIKKIKSENIARTFLFL
jgi:lipopolysaccharide biosynthesis glycosyltransferase